MIVAFLVIFIIFFMRIEHTICAGQITLTTLELSCRNTISSHMKRNTDIGNNGDGLNAAVTGIRGRDGTLKAAAGIKGG